MQLLAIVRGLTLATEKVEELLGKQKFLRMKHAGIPS